MMQQNLEHSSSIPLYLQVVANIRYAIDSGQLKVGDKLPTELELCEEFRVSRITVRKAVGDLVDAGYLVRRQGKGTFVKSTKALHMVRNEVELYTTSFSEACRGSGLEAGSRELGCEIEQADGEDRAFFGLEQDDEVLVLRRVRTADGVPIMLETNRFPRAGFEFLETVDLTDRSLYDELDARLGLHPRVIGEHVLTSAAADRDMARLLDISPGDPLFCLQVGYAGSDGKPLYRGFESIVGARYTFTF